MLPRSSGTSLYGQAASFFGLWDVERETVGPRTILSNFQKIFLILFFYFCAERIIISYGENCKLAGQAMVLAANLDRSK